MTFPDVEVKNAGSTFSGIRKDIQNLLSSHNYPYIETQKIDDFFYNIDNKRFLLD